MDHEILDDGFIKITCGQTAAEFDLYEWHVKLKVLRQKHADEQRKDEALPVLRDMLKEHYPSEKISLRWADLFWQQIIKSVIDCSKKNILKEDSEESPSTNAGLPDSTDSPSFDTVEPRS